ncbi:hypothetical protein PENARI_c024G07176 [Penicillium arizonense]|uniref:Uncharacterized protein n=1 Tax=Penicillium arizonense TaxID=1835702 RepID=A0A1F5L7W6_PENAI|nr:hypothetical protein PENARI_c024G07176 [Penicillium arizonense]OGE49011.1 hypothetical protein PENARI_c024G07176 [Penicillium arizonense]
MARRPPSPSIRRVVYRNGSSEWTMQLAVSVLGKSIIYVLSYALVKWVQLYGCPKLFKGGDVVDNITVNDIVSSTTFAILHLPDELIQ